MNKRLFNWGLSACIAILFGVLVGDQVASKLALAMAQTLASIQSQIGGIRPVNEPVSTGKPNMEFYEKEKKGFEPLSRLIAGGIIFSLCVLVLEIGAFFDKSGDKKKGESAWNNYLHSKVGSNPENIQDTEK